MKKINHPSIEDKINKMEPFEISFPIMDESIKESLHFIVSKLLKKYNRKDLEECIYSSLKEMIINGIKANIKHIIFEELQIDTDSEESLGRGLSILKGMMNEKKFEELEEIARENNLKININFIHSSERMIFIVENNTNITQIEDKRIRDKFKTALGFESIADYYMSETDDSEGTGLGITMVVLLLKGSNIDPHAFTIDTKSKDKTIVKLDIPIASDT